MYWPNFDTSLFDTFRRMEDEMDEAFGRWRWPTALRSGARGAFPPINVGGTADKVEVYLFAPGIDPKSIDLSIERNLLSISGERKVQAQENADYYRRERFEGTFRRVMTLPEDVDPDQVRAAYRDGVLQITVARREAAKPRQVTVD